MELHIERIAFHRSNRCDILHNKSFQAMEERCGEEEEKMKDWRKTIWNRSRVFLQIRVTELDFVGVKKGDGKIWTYNVQPIQYGKKLIINFRQERKKDAS